MKRAELIFIFSLYYAGWLGSVLLAKTKYQIFSIAFPIVLVAFLAFKNQLSAQSALVAFTISIFGIIFDQALISLELMRLMGSQVMAPWLVAIWLLFSFSMVKLGPQFRFPIWIGALLGSVAGPLSYKAGEVFEVLYFSHPFTVWIYAIFWALMFPVILVLSKRFT